MMESLIRAYNRCHFVSILKVIQHENVNKKYILDLLYRSIY